MQLHTTLRAPWAPPHTPISNHPKAAPMRPAPRPESTGLTRAELRAIIIEQLG